MAGEGNLEVMGFPLPVLPDVLGEEIPMDQLLGQENENHIQAVEEDDDLDLDLLVGPGEEGFPILQNGGMQLPPNQAEVDLMELADGMI